MASNVFQKNVPSSSTGQKKAAGRATFLYFWLD